ncbi:hypothetical protein PHYPSEUDO_004630 [Phytophthora pseudosyringae]|uniref:Uncharacterized protein n=1 Tax=Phytophthora pseudosyringae TaxID=221518 RepID=A0A8T1WHG8_9STRA|nr:hypothetical protein PHYPSEUDO_004630 [Phytophthora pseudosyringae]
MNYGGNVEGYLLKIDGDEVRAVYCILDEGMLQFFSRMGGELLGAIALSGSKVDVFLLPTSDEIGQVPNQFRVDAQPRTPSVRRRGARRAQPVEADKTVSMTFAGSTREVTDQWAVSILNWNRYSWEDGQMVCSSKDEYHNLQKLIELSDVKTDKTTSDPVVPAGTLHTVTGFWVLAECHYFRDTKVALYTGTDGAFVHALAPWDVFVQLIRLVTAAASNSRNGETALKTIKGVSTFVSYKPDTTEMTSGSLQQSKGPA